MIWSLRFLLLFFFLDFCFGFENILHLLGQFCLFVSFYFTTLHIFRPFSSTISYIWEVQFIFPFIFGLLIISSSLRCICQCRFESFLFKLEVLDHKARERAGIITTTLGSPVPVLLQHDNAIEVMLFFFYHSWKFVLTLDFMHIITRRVAVIVGRSIQFSSQYKFTVWFFLFNALLYIWYVWSNKLWDWNMIKQAMRRRM